MNPFCAAAEKEGRGARKTAQGREKKGQKRSGSRELNLNALMINSRDREEEKNEGQVPKTK